MACTANTNIPALILPESVSEMDRVEALGVVKTYGLVTESQSRPDEEHEYHEQEVRTEAFDIHPSVHLATRVWLQEHQDCILDREDSKAHAGAYT